MKLEPRITGTPESWGSDRDPRELADVVTDSWRAAVIDCLREIGMSRADLARTIGAQQSALSVVLAGGQKRSALVGRINRTLGLIVPTEPAGPSSRVESAPPTVRPAGSRVRSYSATKSEVILSPVLRISARIRATNRPSAMDRRIGREHMKNMVMVVVCAMLFGACAMEPMPTESEVVQASSVGSGSADTNACPVILGCGGEGGPGGGGGDGGDGGGGGGGGESSCGKPCFGSWACGDSCTFCTATGDGNRGICISGTALQAHLDAGWRLLD